MEIRWHHYKKLPSTNQKAMEAIATGTLHEGDVVWTDKQWRGKGTGENRWESEAGKNLTFSLVLEPHFISPSEQFLLTQIVSLALQQVIEKQLNGQPCSIKWPNDLYVSNKKIAGVLIQNMIKGEILQTSVLGIGINVNQKIFVSDAPNPVSIIHFTNKETKLFPLLKDVIHNITILYEMIKRPSQKNIIQEKYLKHLFQKGLWGSYSDAKGSFEGKIRAVDNFGRLQIEDRKGSIRLYGFKEIKFEL